MDAIEVVGPFYPLPSLKQSFPPASLTGVDSDCQYFLIVWKTFPFLSFYQFAAFLPWGPEGLEILEVLVKVHHI